MDKYIIYVDMESLFDLRQGFLTTKGLTPLELNEYILNDEYNNRETDELMGFTREDYRKEVDEGNMDIVKGSIVTYIGNEIFNRIQNMTANNVVDGAHYIPEVWLNQGNFEFTNEEIDMLKNLMFVTFGSVCNVDVLYIPLKQLSPSFIEENNIRLVYMYDCSEWLNLHGNHLTNNPIPKTEFYFAPIYSNYDLDAIEKLKEIGFRDGFSYVEFVMSPHTKCRFYPTVFYSNNVISTAIQQSLLKDLQKETVEKSKEFDSEIEELLDGCLSE